MAWQLIWCNVRAVVLNATLQLLVIYRSAILCLSIFYSFLRIYFRLIIFCVFFYNSTLVDWCCDFGNSHHKFSLFIYIYIFFFFLRQIFYLFKRIRGTSPGRYTSTRERKPIYKKTTYLDRAQNHRLYNMEETTLEH